MKSGTVRHVWVDAASGLVVRTVASRNVRGRAVELDTLLGDYRETNGMMFPRSIETGVVGRPRRLRIAVEHGGGEPAIDEARFRMPR